MRVLIVNSSGIYGGGEYFAVNAAMGLKKLGLQVMVGCLADGPLFKKCISAGIETAGIGFPAGGTSGLKKNVRSLRDLILTFEADIIHSNTNYDRTASAFAAGKTRAKHVTSCHSLESIRHNITHYVRNRYLTHHFICDGKSIQDLITKKNSIPINRTTVVHNGIMPGEFKNNPEGRKNVRSEFGIKENEIVIGNTGRLVPFKGQNYLLKAFRVVKSECSDARLVIVGDGELADELAEEAKVLGLSDSVTFAGFREDLTDIYSAFDIYAHSSIEGGGELFPFSVLYAMAQSLPVTATSIGDIPEMVKEGSSGYLVKEKSPYLLAQILIKLSKDASLRNRFGTEGNRYLIQNFTLDKMLAGLTSVYEKVL